MSRSISIIGITILLALSIAQAATTSTTTFAVGTCEPALTGYPTISQAVAAVPPNSTILVCPGTYPEQVVITQPLTLTGVKIGNADAAVITSPAAGVIQNATSPAFNQFNDTPIAAQVLIQNTGPVNVNNIAVDGSNNADDCSQGLNIVGIYYQSASGTINHSATRNQTANGCGWGIALENDNSAGSPTVNVLNTSVSRFDNMGIFALVSSGSLVATIQSNAIRGGSEGIDVGCDRLSFSRQCISHFTGVSGSVTGNTVTESFYGIVLGSNLTVKANKVQGTTWGIFINTPDGTANVVQSNNIAQSHGGISLLCGDTGNTITGNTINDVDIGISNNPNTGNIIAPNAFSNVAAITGACN
jgi:hypothetical protein